MVNVFGESVGSGSVDLQSVEKVVTTVGRYEDDWAEINQSYVLGFQPYRVHTNVVWYMCFHLTDFYEWRWYMLFPPYRVHT